MAALSASEILRLWELGLAQHPIDWALSLLAPAYPEATRDELAALPIGQRNALLLRLRAETFGTALAAISDCPKCDQRVEVNLETNDLQLPSVNDADSTLKVDAYEVDYRLPDSFDLAAAAGCRAVDDARALLIERSIVEARRDGRTIVARELPLEVLDRLGERISEHDPQAEVVLELHCPDCDEAWKRELDVLTFLWEEICISAKRLLREIDALARAYAWSHQDILALSPALRRSYLEMVT